MPTPYGTLTVFVPWYLPSNFIILDFALPSCFLVAVLFFGSEMLSESKPTTSERASDDEDTDQMLAESRAPGIIAGRVRDESSSSAAAAAAAARVLVLVIISALMQRQEKRLQTRATPMSTVGLLRRAWQTLTRLMRRAARPCGSQQTWVA
jgi:hypothetical protein